MKWAEMTPEERQALRELRHKEWLASPEVRAKLREAHAMMMRSRDLRKLNQKD